MARLSDRGQMLLIGAITIAVLFISLSIVLNDSQHTPTVAAEASEEVSAGEQASLHAAIRENTRTLMDRAQAERAVTSDQAEYIARNVSVISDNMNRYYAEEDRILDIEAEESDVITASEETDVDVYHVDPSDSARPLVEDRFSAFELTTPRSDFDHPIELRISTDDGDYLVDIDNEASEDLVTVHFDGSEIGTCDSAPEGADVDVAEATVDGNSCGPLDVVGRSNPDRIEVMENQNDPDDPDDDAEYTKIEANDGSDRVYGVDVTVYERTPDLQYERVIRVAPEEVR